MIPPDSDIQFIRQRYAARMNRRVAMAALTVAMILALVGLLIF